jgi:hypothetical protein
MRIQMLRFADDIAITAQDEIYLKRALEFYFISWTVHFQVMRKK